MGSLRNTELALRNNREPAYGQNIWFTWNKRCDLKNGSRKQFLICVDSDGCVFDNMELKHKECFCPATVNVWGLQGVSRFAREACDFVNLYSLTRGINRFPAIIRTLELLETHPGAVERGYQCPDLSDLREFVARSGQLSGSGLEAWMENHPGSRVLETAKAWSLEVNQNIERIVRGIQPFPHAREALMNLSAQADIVIVSQTPRDAIKREWEEQNLLGYVKEILGQEAGSKQEAILNSMRQGYQPGNVLMIGDAPGDYQAAEGAGVKFYPIVPGQESNSWKQMERISSLFFSGEYSEDLMQENLTVFNGVLGEAPTWLNK